MAVFARPSHERQLLTLRYLQVIIGLGYIVAIAATNADTGKWSYESIELATAFGGKQPTKSPLTTQTPTAATLTVANFFVHLTPFDPPIRRAPVPGRFKRTLRLLVRVFIDLTIAILWCLAFAASFLTKKVNFQKLFAQPPYKAFIPAVVFTLIDCGLFLGSAIVVVAGYRSTPRRNTTAYRAAHPVAVAPSNANDEIELGGSGTFGATIVR
ncbi:MAG: hypothetical protein L6R40_000162 [Gallowayella cf. fulva]|nr:MAG: hypothetical protein L6R40_000162 [Xanthomendoza cf. fulva]